MDKSKYNEVGNPNMETQRVWTAEKVGDEIEGRYVGKNEKSGNMKSPMYVLEVEGEKVGIWGSAVIDGRFEKIAIGKMVGIEYLGEKQSKRGNTYKDYFIGTGILTPSESSEDEEYSIPSTDIEF